MTEQQLLPLLDTNQEFGFQREVDPAVVLGGFLSQCWPPSSAEAIEKLSDLISDKKKQISSLSIGGKDDPSTLTNILKDYLKDTLWTNPAVSKRNLKNVEKEPLKYSKTIRNLSYLPLNHRLLSSSTKIQLGRMLYLCLENSLDERRMRFIKKRLMAVEQHQEAEEKIIDAIFNWPIESPGIELGKVGESIKPPERFKDYLSLFKQFGEDMEALLQIDIELMAKSRILLYLERLVNLYALLYYLRIICIHTEKKKKKYGGEPPLILPLCSGEGEELFKDYSTRCFQVYRQKIVAFWREYLKDRIKKNSEHLNCSNEATEILEKFVDNEPEIFRISKIRSSEKTKMVIEKLKKEIKGSLDQMKQISIAGLSSIDQFTEAFLAYNLKSTRTVQRLRRILDWQGPGAGLVAPESGIVKHFHLKPELLEMLVIIFTFQNRAHPSHLSLRNFVSETRDRYGIILGHSPGIEEAIRKQKLPELNEDTFKQNYENFKTMLRELNMLESLSDTAMYVRCPFPFQSEKVDRRNNES